MGILHTSRHLLFSALAALLPLCAEASRSFRNVPVAGFRTVYCVAHDSRGMAWVGTESGLYSYDGYGSYAHFRQGETENTRVHSLCVRGDSVYMGTESGFLVFDIRHDRYRRAAGASPHMIRSLALHGRKLMLGANEGLFEYDFATGAVKPASRGLHDIYAMLSVRGGLLVGCIDGLYRISQGKTERLRIRRGRQPLVNAILQDAGKKKLWIGTEGALYSYDGSGFDAVGRLDGNSVKSLAQDGGSLFCGTDNGLYILDEAGNAEHIVHDLRKPSSIPNNIIWFLRFDKWHNLWIGTDNSMAVMPDGEGGERVDLSEITGNGDGSSLHTMLREPDGTVWAGGTNGLIRFRPSGSGGGFRAEDVAWYRQNAAARHIPHNRIRRMFRDSDGNVIVCTDHGLNIYDRRTGQFRNVIVTEPSGRYTTTWAYDIIDDGQGRYWIGSYMGGVFVIRKSRLLSAGDTVAADRHFSRELSNIHVAQTAIDSRRDVWVVYYDKGIDRISTGDMSVSHETLPADSYVKYLLADSRGNVWIATNREIIRIDARTRKRRAFQLSGRASGDVEAMFEAEGQLYAVMGKECSVFGSDGSSARFAFGGGFTAFSGCSDPSSRRVIFGGNDGIMLFSADARRYLRRHPLTLSAVLVNGKPFLADSVSVRYSGRLRLPHDAVHVSLRLSDMPFEGQGRDVYAYRLGGIDNEWQYLDDTKMEISYNGLPHGDYRLTVCAVDGEGQPAAEVFAIGIRVLPPWWLTAWAKLLYALLGTGLAVWAVNFYMMRRRLADERRQRKEVVRQSQARAAFFANLSQQLKAPIGQIMSHAYRLLPEEGDSRRYQALDTIRRSSVAMNLLVGKAFDFVRPDGGGDNKKQAETLLDIVGFCRRMTEDMREEAAARKVSLTFQTDSPEAYVRADMARFQQLMYAFASQAASLTPAGTVAALSVEALSGIALTLHIPQLVISGDTVRRLSYPYCAPAQGQGRQDGEEDGFARLKEYVEAMGGTAAVSSGETNGTEFRMELYGTAKASLPPRERTPSAAQKGRAALPPDIEEERLMAKIMSAVEAHIDDAEFNVSRLREEVGVGDKFLYRHIKQATGKTPVELIRHIRMQRAAMLLRESRFTVSEVMYMVGFSNSSYFSKCFHKAFGMTPAEYSKRSG